ncbi:MAG: DUF4167 domain-containing protein [Alphaproteobacteria bacterium]|nr:DUF4167 domain-containing protein [Alphaproteobacteria bacterium]
MKPNQRGRFNGRHSNSGRVSRPQTIFRNTALESTGPCGKLRGTALQLHEKYLAAAKDAQIQNDDILAETCFQYADHYMHIQNQAIANEQALHLQQQAARSTAPAAPMQSEQIIDADMPAEETDTTVKVVDLSVPVAAMNAEVSETQNLSEAPAEKPRKVLRPRIIRKPTPDSNQSE